MTNRFSRVPRFWAAGLISLLTPVLSQAQESEALLIDPNIPTIVIYDQEGRPGKWALTPAPKIEVMRTLLASYAGEIAGRSDISLRRTSTGESGDTAADCAADSVDFPFGTADLGGFLGLLDATGHRSAPTVALERAVADLRTLGGGRILYLTDTVSTCEDDYLWVAEMAGPDVAIDVLALGKANELHGLSELSLASGGRFFLIGTTEDVGRLGGPLIDEVLLVGGGSGTMEFGEAPPGDLPLLEGEEGTTVDLEVSGPLFSRGSQGGGLLNIDTGIDICPAFDLVTRDLLDYGKGRDGEGAEPIDDPVAIAFILDASGSMAARQGGETKMVIAKEALATAVTELDGANVTASLWAYGFDTRLAKTAEASCPNILEIVAFGRNQSRRIARTAGRLTAYGYTPLAASLTAAGQSLQGVSASRRIAVLISDGEETCGGDPVAAAANLAGAGVDISTYVVGYDLDAEQKRQLQAVAEAGGTAYLDASDSTALSKALREVVEIAIEKTERIAPSCHNPLRGGLTPETATEVLPGIYTVGELLEPGTYRYYRVGSAEGQRGRIRGLIQSRQYAMTEDGPRENPAAPTALTITLHHPDGAEVDAQPERGVGIPGTAFETTYVDTHDQGFIFGVGDNYRLLSPDSLFEISLLPFADDDGGDAGDDPKGTDLAELGPDGMGEGHIGREDLGDVWRYDPGAGGALAVMFEPENPKFRFRITVYDEASGKRLGRAANKPVEVQALGPVRIEIENRSPSLRPELTAYILQVRHD